MTAPDDPADPRDPPGAPARGGFPLGKLLLVATPFLLLGLLFLLDWWLRSG